MIVFAFGGVYADSYVRHRARGMCALSERVNAGYCACAFGPDEADPAYSHKLVRASPALAAAYVSMFSRKGVLAAESKAAGTGGAGLGRAEDGRRGWPKFYKEGAAVAGRRSK